MPLMCSAVTLHMLERMHKLPTRWQHKRMWFVLLPPGVTFNRFNADLLSSIFCMTECGLTSKMGMCLWSEICIDKVSFFLPVPPHVLVDFVVFPPGHGRSVTDFWGWDAHEARLHFPDDVSGGHLNLNSTNLPRPWSPKIPTVEPGIEPGTSWLVGRDSDH